MLNSNSPWNIYSPQSRNSLYINFFDYLPFVRTAPIFKIHWTFWRSHKCLISYFYAAEHFGNYHPLLLFCYFANADNLITKYLIWKYFRVQTNISISIVIFYDQAFYCLKMRIELFCRKELFRIMAGNITRNWITELILERIEIDELRNFKSSFIYRPKL